MLYTVHNKCEEVPELEYDDGLFFLYFNTMGNCGGSKELKKLLDYIQDSKEYNVTNDATRRLHKCVNMVKESSETRDAYMMWEEKIFYERRDAKAEVYISTIMKKLEKKKSIQQIAEELEISEVEVEKYIKDIKEIQNTQEN